MPAHSAHRGLLASFFFLVVANIAGCDISQEIRDVISQILTGNGGDGCVAGCISGCDCDCTSCDCDCACDCASCEGCTIEPIPGGFVGAHGDVRIANAAQVRVTDHALDFVGDAIPSLIGAVPGAPLPYLPLDLSGDPTPEAVIRVVLLNTDVLAPAEGTCDGNFANGLGADHACVRARMDVNYRTCAYSANPAQQATNCNNGADPLHVTFEVFAGLNVECDITVNSEGITADLHDNLSIEADLALINEPIGPRTGYSRATILDAEVTNNAQLEEADVLVNCTSPSPTVINAAIATNAFFTCGPPCRADCPCDLPGLVSKTIRDFAAEDDDDNLMGNELGDEEGDDVDDLIDDVLDDLAQDPETLVDDGQICMIAQAAADCPPNTTFVTDRKTCTINASAGASALEKRCVSPLLGLEGRLNVGSLLTSISPGLNAIVDFVFAARGNGVTAGNGHNVNFFGGMESLSHDNCVPLLAPGDPGFVTNPGTSIPQVSIFQNSVRPGTANGFDIGAAVSEEFANYALFKLWDSGLLCLTVTSALDAQLSPGVLAPLLFSASINRFVFPLSTNESYLGLAIRPLQPPNITTAAIDDPGEPGDQVLAITITLPELNLDFMFWTNDRYTRLATIQTNLSVDLTLDIVPGADGDTLKLGLGTIAFDGTSILNASSLLAEADLAKNLGQTLNAASSLIASGIGGALPNIALEELINSALSIPGTNGAPDLDLPLSIDFTADSILAFDEGSHPFVGIFFNLAAPSGNPLVARPETTVEVTSLTMPEDRTAFDALTLGQGPLPRLEIAMNATGPEGAAFEYSYRTTFSGWSDWSGSKYAVIEDPSLVLQQRQQVFARARVVGAEMGTDFSSARADFIIDVTEPAIQVTVAPNGRGELQAFDFVYGTELEYRVDGGEWTAIHAGITDLGPVTDATVVEVRDASGNVASNDKLRGRGDPDAAVGGCGCVAAGSTGGNAASGMMLALGVLATTFIRRRCRQNRKVAT